MTIVYCDYASGDDTTGDGTSGNPYKTITQASTGLTGGDEVRCAKSPDPTSLSGTLAWVDGSTSITTSVDLTGSLSAGDFVGKGVDDWDWWEIASITSDTITLEATYSGTTETVASYKLGITDTGTPASASEKVQELNSSGSSTSSRLKISGGWDLAGPTQDGFTWFVQTGANRYGHGLYCNYKSYIEMEKTGFARYYSGLYADSTDFAGSFYFIGCGYKSWARGYSCTDIDLIVVLGQQSSYPGFEFSSNQFLCKKLILLGNLDDGFAVTNAGYFIEIDEIISRRNGDYGIYLGNSGGQIRIGKLTTEYNTDGGLGFTGGGAITIGELNSNYNEEAIYANLKVPYQILIHKFNATGNTTEFNLSSTAYYYGPKPSVTIQQYGAANDSRMYFTRGHVAYKDSTEARGASGYCLRMEPDDDTYPMESEIGTTQVTSTASDITLSAYIKDDADFNGTVEAAIYHLGQKITGWTEWTPTTSYVKNSLVASSADLINNEFLDLVIRVTGTAGNVYVDDFEVA